MTPEEYSQMEELAKSGDIEAMQNLARVNFEMAQKIANDGLHNDWGKYNSIGTYWSEQAKAISSCINELLDLAKQGDYKAQYELGIAYKTLCDYEQSAYWLETLARQKDSASSYDHLDHIVSAMRNLGQIYASETIEWTGLNPKKAFDYYWTIKNNYPKMNQAIAATKELGLMYYTGEYAEYGIPHDPDKGRALIAEWVEIFPENELDESSACGRMGRLFLLQGERERALYFFNWAVKGKYYIGEVEEEYRRKMEEFRDTLLESGYTLARRYADIGEVRMDSSIIGRWETAYLKSTFEFNSDGTYQYIFSNGESLSGRYSISGNIISLSKSGPHEFSFRGSSLVLTNKSSGDGSEGVYERVH